MFMFYKNMFLVCSDLLEICMVTVVYTEEMKSAYRILVRKPEGKRPLWRSDTRKQMMLKRMLGKQDVMMTGYIRLRMGDWC
jgi:hypothetical protein